MGGDARPAAAHMMDDVVLRRAVPEDLSEVVRLEEECYPDPWSPTAFAALPSDSRVHFSVATRAAAPRIVGYVVAWFVLDEGEIANLAIAPDMRRRGIAGRLLDAVLADASARGVRAMFLEVRDSNVAAKRLYAARNFREVGRRSAYYRRPVEDALVLRRDVDPAFK